MIFSYGSGRQQINGTTKNAGELLAILIAMVMHR